VRTACACGRQTRNPSGLCSVCKGSRAEKSTDESRIRLLQEFYELDLPRLCRVECSGAWSCHSHEALGPDPYRVVLAAYLGLADAEKLLWRFPSREAFCSAPFYLLPRALTEPREAMAKHHWLYFLDTDAWKLMRRLIYARADTEGWRKADYTLS